MTSPVTRHLLGAVVLLSALACASPVGPQPIRSESAKQVSGAAPVTARTADVQIGAMQETAAMRVGQTLGVGATSGGRWQVSFSNAALQLLTPLEKLPAPGDDGWVWKALAPGVTEITFTSVPAPCANPPCAPNVLHLTVTLTITN